MFDQFRRRLDRRKRVIAVRAVGVSSSGDGEVLDHPQGVDARIGRLRYHPNAQPALLSAGKYVGNVAN